MYYDRASFLNGFNNNMLLNQESSNAFLQKQLSYIETYIQGNQNQINNSIQNIGNNLFNSTMNTNNNTSQMKNNQPCNPQCQPSYKPTYNPPSSCKPCNCNVCQSAMSQLMY
jgi:hypothetical protein